MRSKNYSLWVVLAQWVNVAVALLMACVTASWVASRIAGWLWDSIGR